MPAFTVGETVLVSVHGLKGCLCHTDDPNGRGGMSIDLDAVVGDRETALDLIHAAGEIMALDDGEQATLAEAFNRLVDIALYPDDPAHGK
jgi:hypothetical protein